MQLLQPDAQTSKDRICIEALVTQGNLTRESQNGQLSLPTLPVLDQKRFPTRESFVELPPDVERLTRGAAAMKLTYLFPPLSKDGLSVSPEGPSIREQWVRWLPQVGGRFTVDALPYLADGFRPVPENYGLKGYWYPTLSYGVDVKRKKMCEKGQKEVGWEWLYVRAEMTDMRNGRFGLDVIILDEEGNVVCTSRHVAMTVSWERNVKGRKTKI